MFGFRLVPPLFAIWRMNRLLLVFAASALHAQEPTLESRVGAIVEEVRKQYRVPGISVGIAEAGQLVLAEGWGRADVEHDVSATADTVYRIGAVTKQFTAAAIMRLVEREKLALDDELQKHLPDFPKKATPVTIRHLLSNTAGIPSYTAQEAWGRVSRVGLGHDELLALFRDKPLAYAPGTRMEHSPSEYYLLGLVIEKVSGQTYSRHMRRSLLSPLGLDRTYYDDTRRIIKKRARGYDVRGRAMRNADFISMKQPFAAGGLVSTVGDLVKWSQALVDGKACTQYSLHLMTKRTVLSSGQRLDYGFGLGMGEMWGHRVIAHAGAINGFSSNLSHYPDDNLVIAVLGNSVSRAPHVLAARLANLMFDR